MLTIFNCLSEHLHNSKSHNLKIGFWLIMVGWQIKKVWI